MRALVARDLPLFERAAGRSDPRPGATPGAAEGTEEGGRSCPLRGLPATRERQKTPLALRHISLSRRTPGRQLASVDLSTEMSTSRTPGRTVCPVERSTGCSTW